MYWNFPELSLRPRVYQCPHPPLHSVASRPDSVIRIGSHGWPVAMHFTPTATVAEQVEQLQALGIDTLLLVASFGNLTHEQVCTLELFAKAVM